MRIFIGTVDVCQWIRLLSEGLREQGHTVITYAKNEPYFNHYDYTLRPDSLVEDFYCYRFGKLVGKFAYFAFRISNKLVKIISGRGLYDKQARLVKEYLYSNTDLYIQLWAGLDKEDADLQKFKERGAKIVTWFVGSEIRDYNAFKQDFAMDFFNIPRQYQTSLVTKLSKLRRHELFADAIFSVPDQSSLALRPYFHLQIPLKVSSYHFNETGNKVPVVVHIPSNPEIKGTVFINRAVETLKSEGLEFIYLTRSNISNAEVIQLLLSADILIDEIILHGPGVLAFEAMLSGCAVATRYYENSPPSFRPPVVSITEKNIVDQLRRLIVDNDYRTQLIRTGREYVTANNSVESVCASVLRSIDSSDYDYLPRNFRDRFIASDNDELELCNRLTQPLKNQPWYIKYIEHGTRAGLQF